MKHPFFKDLGPAYPYALEEKFDRVLSRIERLWLSTEIDEYFDDLLMDKRGGRQGFPKDVMNDIIRLRDFHASEGYRQAETPEEALARLQARGYQHRPADFFRALEDGDKELIDLYVRSNFNIEIRDASGATPMLYALKQGHTIAARILLNAGADVNAHDRLRLTPLLVACGKPDYGYRTITEELINRGANIHVSDLLGNTPFLLAVSGGQYAIAELLAQRGADVSAINYRGETAVLLAARMMPDQKERFERLLDAYSDKR